MIGEVPGIVVAIVIGVVIAALAVGIARGGKETSNDVMDNFANAAEQALT